MRPNTFLIGAPKCGTTALASFLAAHPQGYLGYPKEPSFWSDDLGQSDAVAKIPDEAAYLAIYAGAGDARAVVDASTRYIFSDVAVARVLRFAPDARFIVMLRNPVAVAQAYHMEKCFNLAETETDFEAAWRLQDRRAAGQDIPDACPEARELQYRDVAALGTQLQKVMAQVSGDQLLVLFQEDLAADPLALWQQVQAFLGLDDDGRRDFPVVGGAHFNRFPWLAKIYQAPGPIAGPFVRSGKRLLRTRAGSGVLKAVKKALISNKKRAAVSEAFHKELTAHFAPEVALLAQLTGRNLDHWGAQ